MDLCQTAQHIADHARKAGSAPTACGSMVSDTPGAPAEGVSVSTYTRSARRGLDASNARRVSPAVGGWRAVRNHWRLAPHLFFGLSPDS